MSMRWQPAVRVAPPYHDDPVYIDALARPCARTSPALDFEPERSSPPSTACRSAISTMATPTTATARRRRGCCARRLGWAAERWLTTFQSRFGNEPWLQPYTDKTVERLAQAGIKRLAMVAPGFSADCLETLEEIDVENRAPLANGGEKFAYLPCLNDSEAGIASSRPSCAAS